MSKRHNSSRRRTYGRRQHELHERLDRRTERRADRDWRIGSDAGLEGPSYEAHAVEAPYAFAD
jgi:hypothetical protein